MRILNGLLMVYQASISVRYHCIPCILLNMALIPQYSQEECVFMVLTYIETRDLMETRRLCVERFPDLANLVKSTIIRNFQKYQQHGTRHNRNSDNSGRPRLVRNEQGIEVFRQSIEGHPHQSARRNHLGIAELN